MGRRKHDLNFESFLRRFVHLLDGADGLYYSKGFEDAVKYLYFQAHKHDIGFTSLYDDGLYDSEWSDTATRHIYAGLGYDLFTFCGRFGFEWPKHAEILLKMLYVDDESQIVKAVTPDVCPPSHYWKMFRMARSGLGILTDQEIESVRKALPHRRDWHNIEKGLTQAEIAAILDYEDRTVRNALKACWNYLDTGDRMKAAAAIGLSLPVLAQVIGDKNRKNISP